MPAVVVVYMTTRVESRQTSRITLYYANLLLIGDVMRSPRGLFLWL